MADTHEPWWRQKYMESHTLCKHRDGFFWEHKISFIPIQNTSNECTTILIHINTSWCGEKILNSQVGVEPTTVACQAIILPTKPLGLNWQRLSCGVPYWEASSFHWGGEGRCYCYHNLRSITPACYINLGISYKRLGHRAESN